MINRLLPIVKKEFIHLLRDPRSLAITLFMPVVLLFLYSYSVSFDVKDIPTALLDMDKTAASRDFISKFTNSGYFTLTANLASSSDFPGQLDTGKAKVIINIPKGFSDAINAGKKAEIQILVDGSDPTWASSAIAYINGIVLEYYQGLIKASFIRHGIKGGVNMPINLIVRNWYNETLRSLNFYLPGLICIILMQMSAILTSLTIVSEKEQGTMEALVVSPIRKNELMLGKVLPYVLLASFDIMLVTAIGVFWFQVPFKGSLLMLIISSFIFLTGAMAMGVFFSTNAKTSQEAMQTATLATMLPSLLLSGFIFPIENMPILLQGFSYLIPARYYLNILRSIFLKGVGISAFWPDLLFMTILSLILIVGSVRRFDKRIE